MLSKLLLRIFDFSNQKNVGLLFYLGNFYSVDFYLTKKYLPFLLIFKYNVYICNIFFLSEYETNRVIFDDFYNCLCLKIDKSGS